MEQHFHREIDELKAEIAHLGGMAESAIGKALTSLRTNDHALADQVSRGENEIDRLEVEIEEHLLKLLALYQPVARDLRFLVTVLKVNSMLEFIGDLAESIAEKARTIPQSHLEGSRLELFEMGDKTQLMVKLALDALLDQNTELARQVIDMDDIVDRYHRNHHRIVAQVIESDSRALRLSELSMLSVSRSLERIGDLAATVAEDVIYCVEAAIVRHRNNTHHAD